MSIAISPPRAKDSVYAKGIVVKRRRKGRKKKTAVLSICFFCPFTIPNIKARTTDTSSRLRRAKPRYKYSSFTRKPTSIPRIRSNTKTKEKEKEVYSKKEIKISRSIFSAQ